jgi:hypothetical protein
MTIGVILVIKLASSAGSAWKRVVPFLGTMLLITAL